MRYNKIVIVIIISVAITPAFAQEVWDIAIPLPEGTYHTISYVNIDDIKSKTGNSIANSPYVNFVRWRIINYLSAKLRVHEFIYARILHVSIDGKDFNKYDIQNISDNDEFYRNDSPNVQKESDYIWIVNFSPGYDEWSEKHIAPYSLQYGKIGEFDLPGGSNESSALKYYYIVLEEKICVASSKKAIKMIRKSNLDGSSIIYSDRFYFLKEFFEHYRYYWRVTHERPRWEVDYLVGKMRNYKPEQMDIIEKRLNHLVAGMQYLDFSDSVEYGQGTIFASPDLAKEYIVHWKEHPREFVPPGSEKKNKDNQMFTSKLGLITSSVINYVQLEYDKFFLEPELEQGLK